MGERIRVGRARAVAVRTPRESRHPRRLDRADRGALEGRRALSPATPWSSRPGRLDRSPTGTGLCARMAVLHARGLMRPGDAMSHASVIGTVFDGRIVAETRVGEREGIIPAVRGSAWITGLHQFMVDPSDPFPEGYLVADTWGVSGADTQA